MPRKHRLDFPGAWHHVMNRGVSHRTLYESEDDARFYLSLIAREVQRDVIEVHAFCILPNHFHFLARSPLGELSNAMRRVESVYARRFNRRYDRDGPLFRGRFLSKIVDDVDYRRDLVRYIDHNPVAAGIVDDPALYRYCSAHCWQSGRIPPWLAQDWVRREIDYRNARSDSLAVSYRQVFGQPPTQRIQLAPRNGPVGIYETVLTKVREWMNQRAVLADGVVSWSLDVKCGDPDELLKLLPTEFLESLLGSGKKRTPASTVLQTMIYRDLFGKSFREIARSTGVSLSSAHRRHQLHLEAMQNVPEYAAAVRHLAHVTISKSSKSKRNKNGTEPDP